VLGELQLHPFLTSVQDGNERSASRIGLGKTLGTHWMEG